MRRQGNAFEPFFTEKSSVASADRKLKVFKLKRFQSKRPLSRLQLINMSLECRAWMRGEIVSFELQKPVAYRRP